MLLVYYLNYYYFIYFVFIFVDYKKRVIALTEIFENGQIIIF